MERNMKRFKCLVSLLLFWFTSITSPTTVNGRFTIEHLNNSSVSILLQINTNTGTDDLGGATIVFNIDTSAISFTGNPVKNVDYVSHNFCGGNYSPATVTRPMIDKIWINLDLPFSQSNNGTIVTGSPGWTDVVTIHFDIVDPNGSAQLSWLTTSPFWGIFDADNSTLWQTGEFEDLNGPLPVELISFTGTLLSNEYVLLEWKTASAFNHYGFEIERASSLTTPVQGWETIGFVESYGDPSSLVEYSFTDVTFHSFPIAKYRLKSIDNDGSFQYSYEIEVNTLPLSYELSQNYPNPFNPSTKIRFTIPFDETRYTTSVKLKVYDILGNEVATLVDEEKEPGIYEVEFSTKGLASGIYIYRIESVDFIDTKKMVFLR